MGEWMQARNIRWDKATEQRVNEIREAFSPWCSNRSDAVRKSISLFHVILFTPGVLSKIVELLQNTGCALFIGELQDAQSRSRRCLPSVPAAQRCDPKQRLDRFIVAVHERLDGTVDIDFTKEGFETVQAMKELTGLSDDELLVLALQQYKGNPLDERDRTPRSRVM